MYLRAALAAFLLSYCAPSTTDVGSPIMLNQGVTPKVCFGQMGRNDGERDIRRARLFAFETTGDGSVDEIVLTIAGDVFDGNPQSLQLLRTTDIVYTVREGLPKERQYVQGKQPDGGIDVKAMSNLSKGCFSEKAAQGSI
ncbi:hypothetical protein HYS47_03910 [Candidatus Woesearchaeota archaeon]|nr:hypothetical protein [Candidatus Woesearchaeota archaeon]